MNSFQFPSIDWLMMAPVITVMITGIAALMVEVLQPKRSNGLIIGISLVGLAVAGWFLGVQFSLPDGKTFNGMVTRDITSLVLQGVLLATCFIVFLFSEGYLRQRRIPWGEFYPLALWSTAGGMIMVGTQNLLMIFLGLEVLSIALYVLAGMAREEARSEESAIKYLLMGAFASAFLLMGIAFYYGATGSVDLSKAALAADSGSLAVFQLLAVGVILMVVGVGFKMALVPFHQWTPDVYQGAPTNVTAFMAAASKAAAVGLMIRILTACITAPEFWLPAASVIAAITMVVGNAAALVQVDVKRILGYSSIANAGYVLTAIIVHCKVSHIVSLTPALFFMAAYTFTVLGTFAVLTLAAKNGKEGTRLDDLHGLWKRSPLAAGLLIVFLASQIGIPPTAGFFGKLLIFQGTVAADMTWLGIVLAVTSVLGAAYYLAILRACFVSEEGPVPSHSGPLTGGLKATLALCAAGVFLVLGILPGLSDSAPLAAEDPNKVIVVIEGQDDTTLGAGASAGGPPPLAAPGTPAPGGATP